MKKIGLGGGCHWCTEAVFQSIKGVLKVDQGFIASYGRNNAFSEAIIVHFSGSQITLKKLIKIHLETHKSSSNHSMRDKYRSAIYCFDQEQKEQVDEILSEFQNNYNQKIITQSLLFSAFKASKEEFRNYYQKGPEKPFCKTYIAPKLEHIKANHKEHYQTPLNEKKLQKKLKL
ncbi:peptide-methionine (S)-S-oxide reductase [Euzebyella saccharophila]|uniref:peptide-methionine (S)-S-oxide reductase n=1 Tax=Euzebyella saccharophila TaxID=679664 RepID=A0ABV8JPQ4_9FLAO|nr:peptide-methionine (S)-S-oxide reductase [Euzebyella saccharophila]